MNMAWSPVIGARSFKDFPSWDIASGGGSEGDALVVAKLVSRVDNLGVDV